jgi:hypothetical protein
MHLLLLSATKIAWLFKIELSRTRQAVLEKVFFTMANFHLLFMSLM